MVAFIGRRGSGKDTAATFVADRYERFHPKGTLSAFFAFGDVLKNMANSTLGISLTQSEYLKRQPDIKVANGLDLRSYYNQYGDVLKSRFGKDVLLRLTMERIDENMDALDLDLMLITDVRYPMELAALKKLAEDRGVDFMSIKLVNTKTPPLEDGSHESEYLTEKMDADHEIVAANPQEIKERIEEIFNES